MKNSEIQRYIESATSDYLIKLKSLLGNDIKLEVEILNCKKSDVCRIVELSNDDSELKFGKDVTAGDYFLFCKIITDDSEIIISSQNA